jgi:protein tyrosine/serine phosphatase
MMKHRRSALILSALVVAVATVGVFAWRHYRWKNFGVVEPGRIYRSAQLRPEQLDAAITRLSLRTVICLNPDAEATERRICGERGVRFHAFTMDPSGIAAQADYARIVDILADTGAGPVLVHCRAGVARTGVSVALYRMRHQGWDFDRAVDELRSFEKRGHIEPDLKAFLRDAADQLIATRPEGSPRR